MRILQVNKFYYRRRGAERYYFSLSDLLREHGHTVVPFAMADIHNYETPYQDYFARHLDVSHPGYNLSSLGKIGRIIYNRDAAKDFAALLRHVRPDVVHFHNIYHQLSPSLLPVCRAAGVPAVMTVHDFNLLSPNYDLFWRGQIDECAWPNQPWKSIFHRCVKGSFGASIVGTLEVLLQQRSRIYQNNIHTFIAPSRFVKQKFRQWHWPGADEMEIIPHFVALPAKPPKFSLGNGMLYVGALEEGKGIEAVLHTLADEHINVPLRIAGSGSLREKLEQFVDKNQLRWQVTFLGQLDDDALAKEYAACSFVIVPSRQYETFGFTAVEAMAAGKPVLVSNQGALPELVDANVGAIFQTDQPGSLAREIRAMAGRRDLALLGQAAYARVAERFSPDDHYQKIMAVYERATAGNSGLGSGVKKYY